MAKIGRGRFRWDDHWGDYDIMYSSKDKQFYVDAGKLFSGAEEFFDSLIGSSTISEAQKRLHMHSVNHGRQAGIKMLWDHTQKELEDSVSLFNRMFVTTTTSEKKVILYSFVYKTETQSSDENGPFGRQFNVNEFSMGFKYKIAMKKTLGDNSLYTDSSSSNRKYTKYDIVGMKEIIWTQELEDFIKSFSKSFDGLINKMKPFFEVEGKITELIGKNILMP